jgi:hypothetical protein
MSLDAVLERIGVTLQPVMSNTEIQSPGLLLSSNSTGTGVSSPGQSPKKIKKVNKLNKTFGVSPSKGDPSIRVHPREVLSRGAGFRSPNHLLTRSSPSLAVPDARHGHLSAYIYSPNEHFDTVGQDSNMIETTEEDAFRRYATPPVAHHPSAIEDSLSLNSQSHPMRGAVIQRPPLHSQRVSPHSSSKWTSLAPQDLIPAPVPKDPPMVPKGKKGRQRSAPSSSRRPISTTNYGDGLYAISSYKNILDNDYLEHL